MLQKQLKIYFIDQPWNLDDTIFIESLIIFVLHCK